MTTVAVHAAGAPADGVVDGLAALLVDSVKDGASVGFLSPLGEEEARRWWADALAHSSAVTLLARQGGTVVGCVRVHPAPQANGRHRAEIAKLLVHSGARGRGLARALLAAAEEEARALGRSVLVLDTETGSTAERVYEHLGWHRVGVVEDYAAGADGRLMPTTIFTKRLE